MKRNRISIENDGNLEDVMNDMFHEFLSDLSCKEWATREVDEEEFGVDESWTFIWTDTAHKMIERYIERMGNLFNKYSSRGIHLTSPLFQTC